MFSGFGARRRWAVLIAVAAAFGILLATDGGAGAAAIALIGAIAASMIPLDPDEAPVAAAPAPAEPDEQLLAGALDLLVEPLLLLRGGRVAIANAAAQALLGAHIIGEDARIAVRHPAAAERLTRGDSDMARPVELVGLGPLDQRWEMRVGQLVDGSRLVQLVDRTGSYAAERMRVDFVANASHELRTPLASILGFVETLRDEAGEDAATRDRFLRILFDEASRMQRLVEDLISLSRIEAEKYRGPSERLDLSRLMEEVCAELRGAAGGRGDDLRCAAPPGVPAVVGDRAQLSQMLHNLVGNAMKYGRPGTPVSIAVAADRGDTVRLTVRDEGEGIAPEHIPRLTERFYRVDTGRSRAMGGTGLGLAIVKHIVERHRGRLDIASRQGEGTAVTVTLPAAPPSGAPVIKT